MGFLTRILQCEGIEELLGSQPVGPRGEWEQIDNLTDDFNGDTLDTSKWEPYNRFWKGREPGWFNPANVTVKDGCLELWSREEPPPADMCLPKDYHTFSTAFMRSKARLRYGYTEAVICTSDSITSSSFWMVHNGPKDWNEIDVFESSQAAGHQCKYHTNCHIFKRDGVRLPKTESRPKWTELNDRMCSKERVVGLERDEEWVTWWVNGKPIRKEKNVGWHDLMWIQFDCETMGNWFGTPDPGDDRLPAVFRVHGVRSWKKKE